MPPPAPASPVTFGKITPTVTREETPIPGTLYGFQVPLIYGGVPRGTLLAEFFVADSLVDERMVRFLEGDTTKGDLVAGPRVRWDI